MSSGRGVHTSEKGATGAPSNAPVRVRGSLRKGITKGVIFSTGYKCLQFQVPNLRLNIFCLLGKVFHFLSQVDAWIEDYPEMLSNNPTGSKVLQQL